MDSDIYKNITIVALNIALNFDPQLLTDPTDGGGEGIETVEKDISSSCKTSA